MFRNYLKVALRNLWKNKSFSLINIIGLAVGIWGSVLILLWIQSELSVDRFHTKTDRLFVAYNRGKFDGKLQCWHQTPIPLGPALKKDYPEIKASTRIDLNFKLLLANKNKKLIIKGDYVDPSFLTMLSFPFLEGNPKNALNNISSIVITKSLATEFFGSENPMGKTLKVNDKTNYTVTGVMLDPPVNTQFDFKFLLPFDYQLKSHQYDETWGNNTILTLVELVPGASIDKVNKEIRQITQIHSKFSVDEEVFLYPLSRYYLYSNFIGGKPKGGKIEIVRLFGIIAILILLIACINFMNLSTARSVTRAKEVGIRKVTGAGKGLLILQFIGESVLLSFISSLFALLSLILALPAFNLLVEKQLVIPFFNPVFWLYAVLFVLGTGILAGSYPAFFLSSFKPVKIFKGSLEKPTTFFSPRKVLVVLQFTIAIAMIISTFIIQKQIQYAQERDLGYNKDKLVYHFFTGTIEKNFSLIQGALLNNGIATSVCKTNSPITQVYSDSWGLKWEGSDPNSKIDFDNMSCQGGFVKTFGLKLLQGRDIDTIRFKTDTGACMFNEAGIKVMGLKNPLGKIIRYGGKSYHIVGVLKDFIMRSPYEQIHPLFVNGNKFATVMSFRLNPSRSTKENMSKAEAIFKKLNPSFPFEYHFADESYDKKFSDEKRTAKLSASFAFLTVFISCLGLLGLSIYMAENRVKEIGIRKVLGASISSITTLLAKEFLLLVIVAILIASPLAWWLMNQWLKKYEYHMQASWWIFAGSGALALIIAAVTVSFQSIKAAIANPVKSLRSE